jgi:hypothetical protein
MPDFNGLEIVKAHLFFKYFTITYRRGRKTNALYPLNMEEITR